MNMGLESSNLLKSVPQDRVQQLNVWLSKGTTRLLYCASRDGWSGESFHNFCDSAARTIVLMKCDNGWIVGGYAAASWGEGGTGRQQQQAHKAAPESFLFQFSTSEKAVQLTCSQTSRALFCSPSGPTFGAPDLQARLQERQCSFNREYYNDTSGRYPYGLTFTGGSSGVPLTDIEVYAVE